MVDTCQRVILLSMMNDDQPISQLVRTLDSDLHDHLAIIALKSDDFKLFEILSGHHPRILMDLFSGNDTIFPRLILWYFKTGYLDRSTIPSYIWNGVTIANAKCLYKYGKSPDKYEMKELKESIRNVFAHVD